MTSVHDLHVWEIGSDFPALSAHVLVHPGDDCHAIRDELEVMLGERFEIEHTTLQVDHDRGGRLLRSRLLRGRSAALYDAGVAALGRIRGNPAVNMIVFCSAVVPVVVFVVVFSVFFRAARRNDEREALEKQAGDGPTGR